jgi:hypothetical protein
MAQLLTEGVVDKLLAYFQAQLPSKVQALNDEYSDNVLLKAPQVYFVGERALTDGPNWPALFVFGESMMVERHNASYTDATHEVSIMIAIRDTDTEKVQRAMYRYVRALWELVVARFFASTADDYPVVANDNHRGGIDPQVVYERPPAQQVTGHYIGKATLTLTFNKQEAV